jgi:D-alanyl-lipoteichoic acid acyltransferase DltB (MBOAT superfamily)
VSKLEGEQGAWDGTLRGREYALLLGSLVIVGLRLPAANLSFLAATALAVYGIGEASLRRPAKLAMLLSVLAVYVYLKSQHPQPHLQPLLSPRYFLEAFFILRCVDFALGQRPESFQIGSFQRFSRFLLWMFFLPTVFAGPIASYGEFYRAYQPWCPDWRARLRCHLMTIAWGVFKCVLLNRAAMLVDERFLAVPGLGTTSEGLAGLAPVGLRLSVWASFYLDLLRFYWAFSGFTDIALGLARLAGFNLADNFDRPLWSTNPVRYWKTSNISLYRWLMIHVFFPYWDHRRVTAKVITTFLVSGLWHFTITPLDSWESVLQIGLAFAIFGATVSATMRLARAWRGNLFARGASHPRLGWLPWLGKVALNFSFIALVHRLFWYGLTGKPLTTTLETYRLLIFGAP